MDSETKTDNFASKVFKASTILLVLGILFTSGQVLGLESFVYFNTFTYIDFLVSSALFIPFIFLSGLLCMVMDALLIIPFKTIRGKISKHPDCKFTLTIYIFILIATLISWTLSIQLAKLVGIIGLAILIFMNERKKLFTSESVYDSFDFLLDKLTGKKDGIAILGIIVLFAGWIYVYVQNPLATDSTLVFSDDGVVYEVNLVTSNSNYFVVYKAGQMEIIPRSQVRKIASNFALLNFVKNRIDQFFNNEMGQPHSRL